MHKTLATKVLHKQKYVRSIYSFFNDCWNASLTGLALPKGKWDIMQRENLGLGTDEGEFRARRSEDGVWEYGVWCYDQGTRPRHGGMWSSNAAAFSRLTGSAFVDIVVDGFACAMQREDLEPYLPDTLEIVLRHHDWGDNWEIQSKGDE